MFEVFPEFRQKKFGTNMILGIEEYLWEYGFNKMRLDNICNRFLEKIRL